MKIKRIIYIAFCPIICIVLSSCLEKSTIIDSYGNQPAIVRYGVGDTMIQTNLDFFIFSSKYNNTDSLKGDTLITNFTVDFDNQPPPPGKKVISNLNSINVNSTAVVIKSEMMDFFQDSIFNVKLYYNFVDYVLFFNLTQKTLYNQDFEYEIVYNPDSIKVDTVSLYIKSRKKEPINIKDTTIISITNYVAFEMTELAEKFKNKKLFMKIKYLYGVNTHREDTYKLINDGTLVWDLEEKRIYPYK